MTPPLASDDREAAAILAELLRDQATHCDRLGSPLYGSLLRRAAEDVEAGGSVWGVLRGHERDPSGSVLALRLMGAVHRLVLEGRAPDLEDRYRDAGAEPEATWRTFRATLDANREVLRRGIDRPVQTNEVGRCAALLPGFLTVAEETRMPLRLLEVGASAGLNLRWDQYRYEADGFSWGPPSPLRIAFELSGGAMPSAPSVAVSERRGCDAAPLDPTTEDGRLTLLSYLWADQIERRERMLAALDVVGGVPATLELSPAALWIAAQLAEESRGNATVVFHSIVMQYLAEEESAAFETAIQEAGGRATTEAPLAWLRMEPAGDHADVRLTIWPGGEDRHIARAGYHGTPVELVG